MTEAPDSLSAAMFTGCIGELFRVRVDIAEVCNVELVDVTPLSPATTRDDVPIQKNPFSLVFKGKADRALTQRMYAVEHEAIGSVSMFLVPIGLNEYEVIFN